MPKNKYYDDVIILKKPLKKRFFVCVKFFLILSICFATIFFSIKFSNVLSVGGVGKYLIFGDKKIDIKKSSLYSVTLGQYDSYEQAEKIANVAILQGASGYIWQNGDSYMLIGSIYPTTNEANSVVDNLKNSDYDISVFEINFPKIQINLEMYDNIEVSNIREYIEFVDNIYENFYAYSLAIDKGELNNYAVGSKISELRGECKTIISNIQDILKVQNEKIQSLQDSLIRLDEVLEWSILKSIDSTSTGYVLKNSIAKIVKIKYDLYLNLD